MESWDDENFEPSISAASQVVVNKWDGEDEEEEVKESWEDEEEEERKEELKNAEAQQKPKKKSLAERIAEKERQKREEMERKLREEEEEMSPEERLRRQKESDLKLALETTFGESDKDNKIDDLDLPVTKEEFDLFTETLSKKLTPLSKSVEYPNFVESLTRNLCATMMSSDIRKIKNSLDNMFLEKQKIEKGDKTKKGKGKGKVKLKMEGDNQLSQLSAYVDDYDEFNDFM